ncbi:MAG: hypothetical protein ACOC7S_02945 [Planctomycetota bacterium]
MEPIRVSSRIAGGEPAKLHTIVPVAVLHEAAVCVEAAARECVRALLPSLAPSASALKVASNTVQAPYEGLISKCEGRTANGGGRRRRERLRLFGH